MRDRCAVENSMKKIIPERSFFLSNLQDQIPVPPEKASLASNLGEVCSM
jgi:hypothetical protein